MFRLSAKIDWFLKPPEINKMELPQSLVRFVKITKRTCAIHDTPVSITTYSVLPIDENDTVLRYGSEDLTYIRHPELLDLVWRACSDVEWFGKTEKLRGLRKFSGTTPTDEDPDENALEDAPETDAKETELFSLNEVLSWGSDLEVQFQQKANGKLAVFRLLWLGDEAFLWGGSKNVHVIHSLQKDITGRDLHWCILRVIQNDLKKLTLEQLRELGDKTYTGEYVDGNHIVYTEKPYMVYFNAPESLPSIPLLLPTQNTLPTPAQLQSLREGTNSEGCVIVYRNTKTGETHRHKHKTVWYILLRVMREALCHQKKEKGQQFLHSRVVQRFNKRSKDFLGLTAEQLQMWANLAEEFIYQLLRSDYEMKDLSFASPIGMARVWNDLMVVGRVLPSEVKEVGKPEFELKELIAEESHLKFLEGLVRLKIPVSVILRGPSGSGKSTIAKLLVEKFGEEQCSVHSTDEFFEDENGIYAFDPKKLPQNHKRNLDSFLASKKLIAIVDNTNLEDWEYAKYKAHRVCVVLNVVPETTTVLVDRNLHCVPLASVERMNAKFEKPTHPVYYGVFVPPDTYAHTQEGPLHCTYEFMGKKQSSPEYGNYIGTMVTLRIESFESTPVGDRLNVTGPTPLLQPRYNNPSDPHITLAVANGHTAVEVGKAKGGNVKNIGKDIIGVFGPYY